MIKIFKKDTRGNVAIVFSFALLPLCGMVGLAVDYARATNSKEALQSVLDTAALSLAAAGSTFSQTELQARGTAFVTEGFKPRGLATLSPVVVVRSGGTVSISASAAMNTTFMSVLGVQTMAVSGKASALFGKRTIEMALALDNTGSMGENQYGQTWANNQPVYNDNKVLDQGSKMWALKSSALEFVTLINDAKTKGADIKLGIVPFDTQIRIDPFKYKNEDWIKFNTPGMRLAVSQANWTGCLHDRDEPKDEGDIGPDGTDLTRAPAQLCETGSLAEVQPLTTDFGAVSTRIGQMRPSGWTNVSMGAIWGTALLTKNSPFNEASADANTEKNLLILTDGNNTRSRFSVGSNGQAGQPCGTWGCVTEMNRRTLAACTDAKSKGIRVYTIRLLSGDANMLRDCASVGPNGPLYYDVQQIADLRQTLSDIAKDVTRIRLTD